MEIPDYYKILDVSPDCSQEEIKRSYRKLSLLYHPDKTNNDSKSSEQFKIINNAYQKIGSPEERSKYDMFRKSPFGGGMPFPFPFPFPPTSNGCATGGNATGVERGQDLIQRTC